MTDYQPLYAASRALIIGINAYSDPRFMPLGSAEDDARAIGQVLSQPPYDFGVTLLLGKAATRTAILSALHDLRASQPDERIVVYFAGHGYTLADNFGQETGYLACADTVPERDFTALELNEVTDLRRHAGAKHIAFIFDACFSGQALGLTRAPNIAAENFLLRRAYQVISAGAGDQTVSDFRSMTQLMLELLGGEGVPPDGMLTLSELGLQLQQRMAADSKQQQIPQFGHLPGSQGGELVWWSAEGELLPPEMEIALRSASPNMRMGVVADLVALAGGEGNLSELARERLAAMARSDPDERVQRAAQSFFDEEQARQAIEEARRAREIVVPVGEAAEPEAEVARTPTSAARRKGIPWWVPVGGVIVVAAIVGGVLLLSGVLSPSPGDAGGGAAANSGETVIFSATFDGGEAEALAGFELSNPNAIWVEDGALAVVSAPEPDALNAYVTTSAIYPFRIERPMFFESSMLLSEGDGDRGINMYLIAGLGGDRSWGPGCSINTGEPAAVICGQDAAIGSPDWDMAGYVPVLFDTWHTMRIEIDPETMLVSSYVDGRLVGTLQPDDVDILRGAAYSLDFSSWSPDATSVTGRIDNVRVGYLEE